MRNPFYLIFFLILVISCSSDNDSLQNNDEDTIEPVLNIANFTATINSPIQTRDYSYHNQGYNGVFENPDTSVVLIMK